MAKKHNEQQETAEKTAEKAEGTQAQDESLCEDELPATEPQPTEEQKEPTELEKAQALAEDYKRKWYSVSAEYDNYRKRTAALVPVADTFGYALDAAKDEATRAGIDKIIKNFNAILSSLGVQEIAVNVGDKFDETVAEAVMNVPCGDGEEPNTVKLVLRKGYKQGEKVIRFAQVSVTV